jgi:enterochelin esterase-like enzyme
VSRRIGRLTAAGFRLRVLVGVAAFAALTLQAAAPAAQPLPSLLPASFVPISVGPDGGIVWKGRIPDPALPGLRRNSVVYLPPHVSRDVRYPVLYLLQGFYGGPLQFVSGLKIATVADTAIASGSVQPFIAVAAPAGRTVKYDGEWAGPWEDYLVRDVVPWVDAHLPTVPTRADRALAGLSAGGYGAVDIGLRHRGLFGTLESWSGYFEPFRDGPLRHADARALASHDPSLLVRREGTLLRLLGTRFFLSSGTGDPHTTAHTVAFARELRSLGLPYALYLRPGAHNGRFWLAQLPAALSYALPASHVA